MFKLTVVVELSNNPENVAITGLAPMAVLPDYQKKGIGSQLIKFGLKKAKELGYKSVIVLGHDKYYTKFGIYY